MRRVALRNLQLCFPGKSEEWREKIFVSSLHSFARIVVDSIRLPFLDGDWVREHVRMDFLPRYLEMKEKNEGRGLVIATGHLGSFELLGHAMPLVAKPIAFIVRNFKLALIDAWFNGIREANGNKVISRKGGLRGTMRMLKSGVDVAILFDQNVRKEHAVFVDWFGISAATTSLPAIAALRHKIPIIVVSVQHIGDDNYRVNVVECDLSAIYADHTLSSEEKIIKITAQISAEYEKMIQAAPEEWFWMHRRFRTRPTGDERNLYEGC